MKNFFRILALALALAMAFVCFAEDAAEELAEERVVLMTVGGIPVYQDEAEQIAYLLYYYGSTEEYSVVDGVNYILYYDIAPTLLTAGKEAELLGEENIAALTETHEAQYRAEIEEYASYFMPEEATEEDKAAAIAEAEEAYLAQGVTEESYIADQIALDAFEAFLATLDGTVTDEDVQAYYNQIAAEDEMYLGSDIQMYEYYKYFYNYDIFYQPEGYRSVLHILLGADEELLTAYTDAADEEAKAEAAAAIIAFNQETIDAIYAELDAGATFEEEILKYNTDPGMDDPTNLAEEYAVHRESIMWDPAFVEATFSLDEVGQMSGPYVGEYGIYIVYYLRDVPAGPTELGDDLRTQLKDALLTEKKNTTLMVKLDQWESEADIVYTDAAAPYLAGIPQ